MLTCIAAFMWFEQWRRDLSPALRALLPSKDLLPFHPFKFTGQFLQVYKEQVEERSREVNEQRQREVDDSLKRAEYRKQHGIKLGGVAGWLGLGTKDDDEIQAERDAQLVGAQETHNDDLVPVDAERKRKEPVKKWFGIWS